MALMLILSPFAILSAMMMIAPAAIALFTAALAAGCLVATDMVRSRSPKLMQIGAATLLIGTGFYVVLVDRSFSGLAARTTVDVGMLAIALASLVLRFPFTLQYARERVAADVAEQPDFRRANYVLTGIWTAALITMLAGDLLAMYVPWLPFWTGIAAAFAARNAAAGFTQWYAARRQAQSRLNTARLAGEDAA